jgi:hypothetical protein
MLTVKFKVNFLSSGDWRKTSCRWRGHPSAAAGLAERDSARTIVSSHPEETFSCLRLGVLP